MFLSKLTFKIHIYISIYATSYLYFISYSLFNYLSTYIYNKPLLHINCIFSFIDLILSYSSSPLYFNLFYSSTVLVLRFLFPIAILILLNIVSNACNTPSNLYSKLAICFCCSFSSLLCFLKTLMSSGNYIIWPKKACPVLFISMHVASTRDSSFYLQDSFCED